MRSKTKPGDTWGHLTIIKYIGFPIQKWECLCECGNKVIRGTSALKQLKNPPSCGCKLQEYTLSKYKVGDRIGYLTVQHIFKRKIKGKTVTFIKCDCDCGKTTEHTYSNLQQITHKSCGCKKKEKARETNFKTLFYRYRYAAKKRNIAFNLSLSFFSKIVSSKCHYCGEKESNTLSPTNSDTLLYNGIDRKDNNQGYTEANCVPCCKICNISKNNRSYTEYITWIKNTYLYLTRG